MLLASLMSASGEIIPQALCKSYALLIGNYCAGMVRVLCYAVGIISWPVSKVLDYVLGNEHTVRLSVSCCISFVLNCAHLQDTLAMHASGSS